VAYRTQTRHAGRADHVRIYLTATRKEVSADGQRRSASHPCRGV
jgi:hypothetical protein